MFRTRPGPPTMQLLQRIFVLLLFTSGGSNACPSLCTCPSWSTVTCRGGTVSSIMATLPSTTTSIGLESTTANTLSQTDFDTINIPNLWYFKLTNSLVQTIQDNTFSKFSQLRTLNLTSNQLRNIAKDAFNGLGVLQELDLRSNEIQNIGEIFLPLRSLKKLYLQSNRIVTIPTGSFLSQSNLNTLILDQNEIQSYDTSTFQGLTSLTYLSLRKCELNSITSDLLAALHAIKTLDLGNNAIFTLPKAEDWRRHAPSLSKLLLDHNEINELKSQQFSGMTLRKLDLSSNRLSRISVDNFGLCNIDNLDLSENSIIQVASKAFVSLGPRLRSMTMAHNSIMFLPEDAFYGLYLLQNLNLSSCSIKELHHGQFQNLNQLHYLDLSRNELENVPNGILQSFQFIHRLYLEGNKWSCDCKILPFRNWLQHPRNQLLLACSDSKPPMNYHGCQHPKCVSPQVLVFKEIAQVKDSDIESCTDEVVSNSLPVGAIVGIAITCVIICIIVAIVVFVCWQRRRGNTGFIACKGQDSVISSHKEDFGDREKPKPFTDDQVSLNSDKSFVVRHFFQTMVSTDPSVTNDGHMMRRDTFRSNFSGSNPSLASASSYSYPMGRETAI